MGYRTATFGKILKQHIYTPLYKNAYYLMASYGVTSTLGFVFWIVAARFYTTEAMGLASAIISSLGLIANVSELGLGIGLIRFLPGAGKNSNSMINTCFTLYGLVSIMIALIFLAGLNLWSPALLPVRQNVVLFITFTAFAIIWTLNDNVGTVFLAKRVTKFQFIQDFLSSLLKLALVIPFAFLFSSAFGILASMGLATFFALLVATVWLLPRVQEGYIPFPMMQRKVLEVIGRYSIGNYIARVFLRTPPMVLPLIVINILGSQMNAYFYIAWLIAMALMVIPNSISNSLFAEGSTKEESLRANAIKSLKLIFLLLPPVIVVIWAAADKVLLLFGKEYSQNGVLLLRITVLSSIPWSINYLYITIGRVRKNIRNLIKVSLVLTCLVLGLSYFLILKMGLVGVGIGYLAGQSIVAVVIALHLSWRYYSPAKV